MKNRGLLIVLALGLSAMSPVAHAATHVVVTNLGNFASPPTGSSGVGFAAVTIDAVAHTMEIAVSFSALTGSVTSAHLHCCISPPGNVGIARPHYPDFQPE